MSKQDNITLPGQVIDVLPAGQFKVQVKDMDLVAVCKKSGKMKQFKINILAGDRVQAEISPYDMTKGRITYRYQNERDMHRKLEQEENRNTGKEEN